MPFRILLVEDDDEHAFTVTRGLNTSGVNCLINRCKDGDEAMNFLRDSRRHLSTHRPELVLLDLELPKGDGYQVLDYIKSDKDLMMIPVIVLTTSNMAIDKARAYQKHANSYVVKPVDSKSLKAMFRSMAQYWSEWNQPAQTHDPVAH